MNIIPIKAFLPDLSRIDSNDVFFNSVSELYPQYLKDGYFLPQGKKAVYIYKISSSSGSFVGLIAGNALSDLTKKNILPHENTLPAKEQYQAELLTHRQGQIKPVLCAFQSPKEFNNFAAEVIANEKPLLSIPFMETNELHQLWAIDDDQRLQFLLALFDNKIDKAYIADGHHRCSGVLNLYDNRTDKKSFPDSLLVIYLPMKDLRIYEFNRVFRTGHPIDNKGLLEKISTYCTINLIDYRVSRPAARHIHMLLNHKWYKLSWKKNVLSQVEDPGLLMDTNLFNHFLLTLVLGVTDIRGDDRISYVPGIHGVNGIKVMVEGNEHAIGFMLPVVKKSTLISASQQNLTFPPKSTWFAPRIKNGLVVLPFTSG
jgi:uncharacterized protein (DUF1015 family)